MWAAETTALVPFDGVRGDKSAPRVHNKRPSHWVGASGLLTFRWVPPRTQPETEQEPVTVMQSSNVHARVAPDASRRCDNPDCSDRVHWSGQRGRPALFCSSACRKRAINSALRLDAALQVVESAVKRGALTYRELRATEAEASRLRWLLSAYPASARTARSTTGRAN